VLEALMPAVLEQKVTGVEARRSWRRLVAAVGDQPPGPAPEGMKLPPTADQWRAVPSWQWHRAGVGPQRAATIVRAASRGRALGRLDSVASVETHAGLTALPGVGAWTSAETRQRSHGDPDAISVGDFHLAATVVYALTGRRGGDDAAMLELLEPYAGQRYRVTRLIELSGIKPERRAPRYSPLDHRGR
jgi:3-methyladenine DNA glycosylase/8-oxoguanine DNA glycosylase